MRVDDGKLYIVATPIGNLADITFRAVEVLKSVDLIAAEDTRHSRRLLLHYGVTTATISLHEHNEQFKTSELVQRLAAGAAIALIADAGTPLISDPGFPLVRMAREAGVPVVPVPGACALIAALSVSGLPTDRFRFEGFAPRTRLARQAWLEALKGVPETTIFYESSHRIRECLTDIQNLFPADRAIAVARELTKIHETVVRTVAGMAVNLLDSDSHMEKGEFVVLLEGAGKDGSDGDLTTEELRILKIVLKAGSVKTAADLAAEITGGRRKVFYRAALRLAGRQP